MAFTPILTDLAISGIRYNTNYRNANRESLAGSPVYYAPSNWPLGTGGGYGGPKYVQIEPGQPPYYNYNNSPSNIHGNCTWWCCARLMETMGTSLGGLGDAWEWYDNYSGNKDRNANNINPGDIIVYSDNSDGHVMFVESVSGDTIYISHSAYSARSFWNGYACRVGNFQKSEIRYGNSVNIYSGRDTAYYCNVVGVIHTGAPGPGPTPGTETPKVTVSPSSYVKSIEPEEDYVDFPFTVVVEGIPDGYTASGSNTYPGLDRVYNTGWSYYSYVVDGVTYQKATKQQTLRYYREDTAPYVTTKYMYYSFNYPNGSASSTTPMTITVERKRGGKRIMMIKWDGTDVQIR